MKQPNGRTLLFGLVLLSLLVGAFAFLPPQSPVVGMADPALQVRDTPTPQPSFTNTPVTPTRTNTPVLPTATRTNTPAPTTATRTNPPVTVVAPSSTSEPTSAPAALPTAVYATAIPVVPTATATPVPTTSLPSSGLSLTWLGVGLGLIAVVIGARILRRSAS